LLGLPVRIAADLDDDGFMDLAVANLVSNTQPFRFLLACPLPLTSTTYSGEQTSWARSSTL
jgi:hypothetical protein